MYVPTAAAATHEYDIGRSALTPHVDLFGEGDPSSRVTDATAQTDKAHFCSITPGGYNRVSDVVVCQLRMHEA